MGGVGSSSQGSVGGQGGQSNVGATGGSHGNMNAHGSQAAQGGQQQGKVSGDNIEQFLKQHPSAQHHKPNGSDDTMAKMSKSGDSDQTQGKFHGTIQQFLQTSGRAASRRR